MDSEPLLDILHADPDFVVVNKLSGMLAVPGRGPEKIDSVAHRVRRMYPSCIEQPAVASPRHGHIWFNGCCSQC